MAAISNTCALRKEPGFVVYGPVHERIIRFGELDRFEAEFRAAVKAQYGVQDCRLELRPHYDPLLNNVGDRLMVAFQ